MPDRSAHGQRRLVLAIASILLPAALPALELVHPDATWATATPEDMGMSTSGLQDAFAAIGTDRGNTVVIRYGRLVWTDGSATIRRPLKSASKSIVAMIAARLAHSGEITFDQPIPLSNDPVTVASAWGVADFNGGHVGGDLATYRHFMSMTSDFGLSPHLPGQQHAYNNNAIHFYAMHMNRNHFGDITAATFLERALFDHVGGHQDAISFAGQYGGWGDGWSLSARDLARLGLLVLSRGSWGPTRLLPADWCDALYRNQIPEDSIANHDRGDNTRWNQVSSTDNLAGHYSYGFWLLDVDACTAIGKGGNYLIVDRRNALVVAVINDKSSTRPDASTYLREIRKAVTGVPPDGSGAPTVAVPAAADPSPVTATTTSLTVSGADDGGEAALTYSWALTGTPPAPVTFSPNGIHAARDSTATFTAAGTYRLQVTIADSDGLSTSSSVTVDVVQGPSSIRIAPP